MQNQQIHSKRTHASGFTLIEILIAVAIVGIIASIAVPSYTAYVTDARRTDGQVALRAAAQSLERCRTETFTYAGCAFGANSDSGYYSVTMSNDTSTTYTLTATAVAGRSQSGDTPCVAMTIDQTGAGMPLECW